MKFTQDFLNALLSGKIETDKIVAGSCNVKFNKITITRGKKNSILTIYNDDLMIATIDSPKTVKGDVISLAGLEAWFKLTIT
jgi:hypothetical protein